MRYLRLTIPQGSSIYDSHFTHFELRGLWSEPKLYQASQGMWVADDTVYFYKDAYKNKNYEK